MHRSGPFIAGSGPAGAPFPRKVHLMFDITTQQVADTVPIHVKAADGTRLYHDNKPVLIIVYGPGSDVFDEVTERQVARAIKRREENDGKIDLGTKDERRAELAQDLADLTVRFDNLAYPPAGAAEGKELFRALYSDQKLGFIAQQVAKETGDWGKSKLLSSSV